MLINRVKKTSSFLFLFSICLLQVVEIVGQCRLQALERLKAAYPDCIQEVFEHEIVWADGQCMQIEDTQVSKSAAEKINNPSLADQLEQSLYVVGKPESRPEDDPGRIRFEQFFRKMYGNSPEEVQVHLENILWMPNVLGAHARILRVTRINNIHEKIQKISEELEELVSKYPEYIKFVDRPGGTFCWRMIAGTNRLRNHSFGMTIDINVAQSHYWQWDLKKQGSAVCEEVELPYKNAIPWEIVEIFEKHGFIWGGKWYHYDTMHFEYRPELLVDRKDINLQA